MQLFYITRVQNHGRPRWMVSYPGELPEGRRRARPRRQKMFSSEEAARVFMRGRQREYILSKRLSVGWDAEEHRDILRAKAALLDVPGARDRKIELEPRTYLGLENVARKMGCKIEDALPQMKARSGCLSGKSR